VSAATECLFFYYSIFPKLRTPGSITKMLLIFEVEAKSLRSRPKGPEAEARGYEAETVANAKILALRPVWPRDFNISGCHY